MSANRFHNALAPGYRLHWYEIESVLGQGGFGITYLATDTNLAQSVAIKEFLPSDLAVRTRDSEVHPISDARSDTFGWGLTRFLTEARTLAQFRHPNIVRVYSVFEANGTAYMVMEYEHGTSLEDSLKFRRLEGERALLSLVHALMDGLELVHQAGFIHRDIKPDNIFMRAENGVPVLLDFGSARQAVGVETRTLTSLVTPGYAPFEQYNATRENDRQGPWTDIYSLAATLYRGVTGAGPVDAVARADALLSAERDPLVTLARLEPVGFSPQFIAAIDRGLAFQSADRPQSLAAWRAMLPARPTTPDFTAARSVSPVDAEQGGRTLDADEATVVSGATTREDGGAARTTVADHPVADGRDGSSTAHDEPRPPRARSRLVGGIAAVAVFGVVMVGGAWLVWQQFQHSVLTADDGGPAKSLATTGPALEDDAVVKPDDDASLAAVPDPASAPGRLPDTRENAIREDALAAQRAQLERDRAALLVERQKLDLRAAQQARELAQREAREQARLLQEQREQLRIEDERQERLRAQREELLREQERADDKVAAAAAQTAPGVAQNSVRPLPGPTAVTEPQATVAVSPEAAPQVRHDMAPRADETAGRIDALLAQARADEAALRLTSPEGNNALLRYREVLALDANNALALAGLASVVSRYLALAEQAGAAAQFERAATYLQRARLVDATDARIEQLGERLAHERQGREQAQAQQLAQAREARQLEELEAERRAGERAARFAAEQQSRAQAQALEAQQAALKKAQADAAADELRRVRLGIFPNETLRPCYVPVGFRIDESARKLAAANPRVDVTYSFYAPGPDAASLGSGAGVWRGTAVHKEPLLPVVQAGARAAGADAVLMGWYHCHDSPNINDDTYRVWLYLVDVRTGVVRVREAPLLSTSNAVRELLFELSAARGL